MASMWVACGGASTASGHPCGWHVVARARHRGIHVGGMWWRERGIGASMWVACGGASTASWHPCGWHVVARARHRGIHVGGMWWREHGIGASMWVACCGASAASGHPCGWHDVRGVEGWTKGEAAHGKKGGGDWRLGCMCLV
eukprot:362860-Chlamydomonas_euryale.AAC.11